MHRQKKRAVDWPLTPACTLSLRCPLKVGLCLCIALEGWKTQSALVGSKANDSSWGYFWSQIKCSVVLTWLRFSQRLWLQRFLTIIFKTRNWHLSIFILATKTYIGGLARRVCLKQPLMSIMSVSSRVNQLNTHYSWRKKTSFSRDKTKYYSSWWNHIGIINICPKR